MECQCNISERPETIVLRQLTEKGSAILKGRGIDAAVLARMGYSEPDALFALKMAACTAGLMQTTMALLGMDANVTFLFVDERPGVANTINFLAKDGKTEFIIYANNIKEAFASRIVWLRLHFPGITENTLMLALTAKAVRRYLNYRGLVLPFSPGDARFAQGLEFAAALEIADIVCSRHKGRLSANDLGIKCDGVAVQMIILAQSIWGGRPLETIEQLVNYVTMGHPDRASPPCR